MKLKKCFSELKIYYQLLSLNDSTFDEYVETIKSIEIIFSDKLSKDYKVHELTLMVNDLQIDIKEIKSDILEFIQLGKLKKIRKEKTKANKEILFALDKKEGLGLSQKFLRKLRRYRAISDLSALKYFLDENNGVKNDELFKDIDVLKLQRNIDYYLSNKDCLILNEAQSISDSFISNVSAFCKQTFVSGKVLRYCEVVDKIIILIRLNDNVKIKDFFNYINKIEEVSFVEKQQEYLFILKWDNRINIELRILGKEYFELECFKTSCSMEHLEILAKEYGYKDERFLECKDERILYKSLGLDFIPPELREGKFEFIYNKRISEIVTFSDLKGIFHIHTRYSDGSNTIEEYVLKCLEYNFEYMGISDHSSSLTSDKLKQQHEEIDFLNNKYKPFKIFKGIEVDVDQNGDYEYDSQLTDNFDFIIASFHQSPLRNNFSNEFITNLYLKVITNKSTKIIGHPLRRCLPFEPGFEIDIDVFKESCLHSNVAIEFNTERKRFDIDWRLINDNISLESPLISINPDAHNIEDIETLKNGVINIRKGFLLKNRTLNTLNSSEILNYFNK